MNFHDISSFFNAHNRKARAWCLGLFFLCWFALGISIYKQYGISWDESIERTTGIVSVNYLGEKLQIAPIINNETLSKFKHHQLETYPDRVFGPLFGIVSVLLERAFHIGGGWNEKEIFQFRHLRAIGFGALIEPKSCHTMIGQTPGQIFVYAVRTHG
jgi:hypothetical protein